MFRILNFLIQYPIYVCNTPVEYNYLYIAENVCAIVYK